VGLHTRSSNSPLQKVAEMRRGIQFTVDDFHTANPTHALMKRLVGGAFGRGLPLAKDLMTHPNLVTIFRKLIRNGDIEEGAEKAEETAVKLCHRNGWIQSYENRETTFYTFSSPLHCAYLSWLLNPSDNMPIHKSIFELCSAVISKFKPSQMHIPLRRVGALSNDSLPEAQYQDEFYRSLFTATAGNVRISPEFASARGAHMTGRIDFFIPKTRWGIEIIRDGNRLEEHSSRFENSGAYGAWLLSGDMTDYILLDCRTKVPQRAHPGMIPNL